MPHHTGGASFNQLCTITLILGLVHPLCLDRSIAAKIALSLVEFGRPDSVLQVQLRRSIWGTLAADPI
jgi:hypothetical protein